MVSFEVVRMFEGLLNLYYHFKVILGLGTFLVGRELRIW